MKRRDLLIVLVLVLVALGLGLYWFTGSPARQTSSARSTGQAAPQSATAKLESEVIQSETPSAATGSSSDVRETLSPRGAARTTPSTGALIAVLVSPDGSSFPLGALELARSDDSPALGAAPRFLVDGVEWPAQPGEGAERFVLEGLSPRVCRVQVLLAGFEHEAVKVMIKPGEVLEKEIVLFAPDWLALIVAAESGASLDALARSSRQETASILAAGIRAAVAYSPPRGDDLAEGTPLDITPGIPLVFEGLRGVQGIRNHLVGVLHLPEPPPCWIGLAFGESFVGWQAVPLRTRSVRFVLDEELVRAAFARVTVRVVDAASGAPLEEAMVSLRDPSGDRRREDVSEVHPDAEGRVVFERVLAGEYDLVAQRGALSFDMLRVSVRAGEDLDAGTLVLADGPTLRLLVVDEEDRSAEAVVHVVPLIPGRLLDPLASPLFETADGGEGTLPRPGRPVLLWARSFDPGPRRSHWESLVLFDPALEGDEFTLVLHPLHEVEWVPSSPMGAGARFVVEDELGMLRWDEEVAGLASWTSSLPAGTYIAKLSRPGVEELVSTPIVVGDEDMSVALP